MKTVIALAAVCLAICGCDSKSDVTASDTAAVRAGFSQDKYEAAMKAAGKGAELEKEKAAAAKRGDGQ